MEVPIWQGRRVRRRSRPATEDLLEHAALQDPRLYIVDDHVNGASPPPPIRPLECVRPAIQALKHCELWFRNLVAVPATRPAESQTTNIPAVIADHARLAESRVAP